MVVYLKKQKLLKNFFIHPYRTNGFSRLRVPTGFNGKNIISNTNCSMQYTGSVQKTFYVNCKLTFKALEYSPVLFITKNGAPPLGNPYGEYATSSSFLDAIDYEGYITLDTNDYIQIWLGTLNGSQNGSRCLLKSLKCTMHDINYQERVHLGNQSAIYETIQSFIDVTEAPILLTNWKIKPPAYNNVTLTSDNKFVVVYTTTYTIHLFWTLSVGELCLYRNGVALGNYDQPFTWNGVLNMGDIIEAYCIVKNGTSTKSTKIAITFTS